MPSPLDEVNLACLPLDALSGLAPLRTHNGLEVMEHGGRLWLRWQAGDEDVLRWLLPLPGAELFVQRERQWFRPGQHLPAFDIPAAWQGRRLELLLAPGLIQPISAPLSPPSSLVLRLVRDEMPRPASALRCSLDALASWANEAPTADIESLRGACRDGSVLVLGERLPPLAEGERFWGRQVLVPLGYRSEPALPESALRSVLVLTEGELALLGDGRAEVIPASAVQPLTRAGIRLAHRLRAM